MSTLFLHFFLSFTWYIRMLDALGKIMLRQCKVGSFLFVILFHQYFNSDADVYVRYTGMHSRIHNINFQCPSNNLSLKITERTHGDRGLVARRKCVNIFRALVLRIDLCGTVKNSSRCTPSRRAHECAYPRNLITRMQLADEARDVYMTAWQCVSLYCIQTLPSRNVVDHILAPMENYQI